VLTLICEQKLDVTFHSSNEDTYITAFELRNGSIDLFQSFKGNFRQESDVGHFDGRQQDRQAIP